MAEVNMVCRDPVRIVDGENFSWYGDHLVKAPDYFGTVLAGLLPPRIEA